MKELKYALKQIIPIIASYVFVGIAFGILTVESGYPVWMAIAASIFIYAGSMQIVMISLMLSGVPLYMIGIMALFVNGRLLFYSLGMIERFKGMGAKYPYMALTLTDETFSVLLTTDYPKELDGQKIDFYTALIPHLMWISSCAIGALFGSVIPFDLAGIEFSATAFFVTVVVNQWREAKTHIPAIIGLISGIFFFLVVGPSNFILPALSVSMISLLIIKDKILLASGGCKYD
ncbi:MAG: AzlC family ABC transporter permease [Tissierellia bacterium]|nr:AzlC family ABC transporter permease [Tissierellia bacterium]